ncbi:hypothetical protein [Streptacidiphilus cavernicola]|uniref:Uncharacterized protein n=1 Tax=Streptacidiphilus cavernicola TaxID=3342716 RepID=A0ABV6VVR6_9ACTN
MSRTFVLRGCTALALAALAASLPVQAQAATAHKAVAVPVETCSGLTSASFAPGLTDTATAQTVTASIRFGADADVLGLVGPYNCSGSGAEIGGTLNLTAHVTMSCTESASAAASWTGTIAWDDGHTSQVTSGTNPENNRDHGDGTVRLDGSITSGTFNGHTVTVELADATGSSGNCESTGVKALSGSVGFAVN